MWEDCTWVFELVVLRYLEEPVVSNEDEEAVERTPTIVVCSGDFVEQV
jgi:transcription initiation factor TFIID subunit 2